MDPVLVLCPTCDEETDHEVLKERPQRVTVRCLVCGDTRTMSPPQARIVTINLVVSAGDQSHRDRLETFAKDHVAVGDEFEQDGHRMLVTAIEDDEARHVQEAPAHRIKTLFAKHFDKVTLKFTLNEGAVTRSLELEVEPEEEIQVGQVLEVQGRLVHIKTLKSDQNRTLHKGFLFARNVRRVFCDPAPRGAQAGDQIRPRRRGLPQGALRKDEKRLKGHRFGSGGRR